MINPPHTITPCTVTSPFPSPPHFALTPSHLTCLTGSQFIYIITLHFICGTYIHACIKGTLRHVSYFHCRHVHNAIPAVTELYRHSIVLRYCRYMHSMCPLASWEAEQAASRDALVLGSWQMHNIQPVHPPSNNIVASPNTTVDTGIYSTAHTSTLSCFLPHIHLSSYIHSTTPPLPFLPLPSPSCCDTFTLGTSVLRHVQVGGRGCVQNSKHSYS